ncbi:MAG: hypothetical protein AB1489_12090 [Acidobacteriota bacterium]
MGFEKFMPLGNTGLGGNYWKILDTNINWHTKYASITIGCFKDKATADAGGDYITLKGRNWIGTDFPFTATLLSTKEPRAIVYEKLKTPVPGGDSETNFFTDAIDVLESQDLPVSFLANKPPIE